MLKEVIGFLGSWLTLALQNFQEAYYGAEYEGVSTYMAPEVYDDYEQYSEKSDVWSLGCLMAFRLNRHVFWTIEEVQAYGGQEYILDEDVYEEYSSDLVELVLKMTKPNKILKDQQPRMCMKKLGSMIDKKL